MFNVRNGCKLTVKEVRHDHLFPKEVEKKAMHYSRGAIGQNSIMVMSSIIKTSEIDRAFIYMVWHAPILSVHWSLEASSCSGICSSLREVS